MKYPGSLLPPEVIDSLRTYTQRAEEQGQLLPQQLSVIYKQKWFHLFVPRQYGGLELSLPEAVRLEESIAWIDGSVGWVVTLCAGATMFIGYLDKTLAAEFFVDPQICFAGSGQVNGTAQRIKNGFEVSGSWPYASGAPHASHFTANCKIEPGGQIHSFIFKKEEVSLEPNWKYLGLNATAGYSFSVRNIHIPANRTFVIDPAAATLPQPVYRYPFSQLAHATIAANVSGMCMSFLELAEKILTEKQVSSTGLEAIKNKGLELISSALADMELLRNQFYTSLDASWDAHISGNTSNEALGEVNRNSLELARQSRDLVNAIYPYCGMYAARTDTMISQVWRNINTASQHSLLQGQA